MKDSMNERPLTTSQVSEMLGVSPETVVTYGEKGLLAGFQLPGGHWRFDRSDVERVLNGSKAAS